MDYTSMGYFDDWEMKLGEWGDLHSDDCSCKSEDPAGTPYDCDCDMQGVKPFFRKVLWYKRQKLLKEIESALIGRLQIIPANMSYSEAIHDAIKIVRGQEGEI